MGCIYETNDMCSLCLDRDDKLDMEALQQGCDDDGVCVVSDDPDPSYSCDAYESDSACPFCDTDWNVVEECDCD